MRTNAAAAATLLTKCSRWSERGFSAIRDRNARSFARASCVGELLLDSMGWAEPRPDA